jgi:lipoate-protein ligase A
MPTGRVFETLKFWRDDETRTGAENMAVDQLLMECVGMHPVLRVYGWSEPTVSFGYFLAQADARASFSADGLTYVRRWTGGGIVDHRIDITYTLAIPRAHALSVARGAESYRVIHQALANALLEMGEAARLSPVDEGGGALACFDNPVAYDITNAAGQKIAGAGQRRTRFGLLHQGSVVTAVSSAKLGQTLTSFLSTDVRQFAPEEVFFEDVASLASDRYATDAWLCKK